MKISITILEPHIDGRDSSIDITSDNFDYISICPSHHGLQSQFSQLDKEKDDKLKNHCSVITDEVRKMIEEKLI